MRAVTLCNIQCYYRLFLAFLLCSCFLQPSVAFKLHGGYDEEKVPMTVIVPDPLQGLSPLAAPPPVSGADDMPRLPTERWRPGSRMRGARAPAAASAPWAGQARAPAVADAPAPESGAGAAFIKSSPAVPIPRGVTDTATILPMSTAGDERQDVGAATLVQATVVPLVVGFIMMVSFGALC